MPYQGQISGMERPPSGYLPEYVEINPQTGLPVDYDGHVLRGPREVFLEAKDGFRGLAFAPDNSYWLSRAEGAVGQATRQLDALPEGAVLEWHVSDPYGAAALRELFDSNGLYDVTVIYTPKL
ncbi:Tox-REase-5 domain-containing protein [Mycobacterium paragordonae]|uniref:Tox-REase-5 domain-containing protein n=2 Tax=Mycobacterium paragordonae TaxID=1389713 RepID=A0AAJ1S3P8_9MYCO|nr:Tox-REase-5 domain-containing protein [Mycobacterium paragordonae]MDP7735102.1 Tox-REase-5 domain-containing protein [Mycobacterium paragordonae]